MKKSKIFLATGALALAISAVFATKASRKFVTFNTAASSDLKYIVRNAGAFTSDHTTRAYLQLYTATSDGSLIAIKAALFTAAVGIVPIYYHK
jgi:hypothetical protein